MKAFRSYAEHHVPWYLRPNFVAERSAYGVSRGILVGSFVANSCALAEAVRATLKMHATSSICSSTRWVACAARRELWRLARCLLSARSRRFARTRKCPSTAGHARPSCSVEQYSLHRTCGGICWACRHWIGRGLPSTATSTARTSACARKKPSSSTSPTRALDQRALTWRTLRSLSSLTLARLTCRVRLGGGRCWACTRQRLSRPVCWAPEDLRRIVGWALKCPGPHPRAGRACEFKQPAGVHARAGGVSATACLLPCKRNGQRRRRVPPHLCFLARLPADGASTSGGKVSSGDGRMNKRANRIALKGEVTHRHWRTRC
jgi:hypothetical protein